MAQSGYTYKYTTPPTGIEMTGDIMPARDVRGDGSADELRGEDIAFLLEACRLRQRFADTAGEPVSSMESNALQFGAAHNGQYYAVSGAGLFMAARFLYSTVMPVLRGYYPIYVSEAPPGDVPDNENIHRMFEERSICNKYDYNGLYDIITAVVTSGVMTADLVRWCFFLVSKTTKVVQENKMTHSAGNGSHVCKYVRTGRRTGSSIPEMNREFEPMETTFYQSVDGNLYFKFQVLGYNQYGTPGTTRGVSTYEYNGELLVDASDFSGEITLGGEVPADGEINSISFWVRAKIEDREWKTGNPEIEREGTAWLKFTTGQDSGATYSNGKITLGPVFANAVKSRMTAKFGISEKSAPNISNGDRWEYAYGIMLYEYSLDGLGNSWPTPTYIEINDHNDFSGIKWSWSPSAQGV